MRVLNVIISAIESLEAKQVNGTITFEEAALLNTLILKAEEIIYNK
jgi:hypothetical protein